MSDPKQSLRCRGFNGVDQGALDPVAFPSCCQRVLDIVIYSTGTPRTHCKVKNNELCNLKASLMPPALGCWLVGLLLFGILFLNVSACAGSLVSEC